MPETTEPTIGQKIGEVASATKEQAQRFSRAASSRVLRMADKRKGFLASELENTAGTLDRLASDLESHGRASQRQLVGYASEALHSASRKVRERSAEELLDSAEQTIKSRPGLFIAGCLAAGFFAGRLLKG